MQMTINEIFENKSEVCNSILRSLPQWFGIEEAIVDYVHDVQCMPTFVARRGDEIIGFLSIKIHNEFSAEIHVMGVLETYHRHGVGRQLVQYAEEFLRRKSYKFFSVKTLSSTRECEEYERTRKFYLSVGFYPLEEFKTLWGEGNPCLMLVKSF